MSSRLETPGLASPVVAQPIVQDGHRWHAWGAGAALIGAMVFPGVVGFQDYMLFTGVTALGAILLANGYNVLIGMSGQFAMAHVAFFGVGAYVSALLVRDGQVPYLIALLAAIALPTVLAWIIARAAVKFTGPYLAMITFAFHSMAAVMFMNWDALTNGWRGVTRIPPVTFGDFEFRTPLEYYYLMLAVVAVSLFVIYRIKYSRVGRAFFAIRHNRLAAKAAGINTTHYITIAFCLSGAFAGLAGSLHAHFIRYIDPSTFGFTRLIDLLIIVIVGGRGNILGVTMAAVFYVFALEYLRFLQDWKLMFFGALLIVMISVSPDGMGGLFKRLTQGFKER